MYFGLNRPLSTRLRNNLSLFNEYMLLVCCVVLMFFTEAIPDIKIRYSFGWVFNGGIIIVLIVNYWFIIGLSIYHLKLLCLRKKNALKWDFEKWVFTYSKIEPRLKMLETEEELKAEIKAISKM